MKRAAARVHTPDEIEFMQHVMLALGRRNDVRIWRQNCGSVPIRDRTGRVVRYFHAGPPNGASDLSGIVRAPASIAGLRLELELKSPTGTRSLEQIRWGDFITASGGIYVLLAYDAALSLEDNVHRAVEQVDRSLTDRSAA